MIPLFMASRKGANMNKHELMIHQCNDGTFEFSIIEVQTHEAPLGVNGKMITVDGFHPVMHGTVDMVTTDGITMKSFNVTL